MRISDDVFSGSKRKHFNFFGCAPPPPLPPPHPRRHHRQDLIQDVGVIQDGQCHPNPDVMVTQHMGSGVTQPGVIQTTCATSGGGHYLSTARIHHGSSSQATTSDNNNDIHHRLLPCL